MSSAIVAAQQRRSCLLASTFFVPILSLGISTAEAQQSASPSPLPPREPGSWLPIAGGTDVMVQYAAGKLPARKLVSIWNLPELRRIEVLANEIRCRTP